MRLLKSGRIQGSVSPTVMNTECSLTPVLRCGFAQPSPRLSNTRRSKSERLSRLSTSAGDSRRRSRHEPFRQPARSRLSRRDGSLQPASGSLPVFPEVRVGESASNADLGIHLALTIEWTDLRWWSGQRRGRVPSLVDAQGYFPLDTPDVAKNAKMTEVEYELRLQIDRAKNAGIPLTHLDMHMAGMVSSGELFGVYRKLARRIQASDLLEPSGTHGLPAGISVTAGGGKRCCASSLWEPGVAPNNKDWLDWYRGISRRCRRHIINSSCTSPMTTRKCAGLPGPSGLGRSLASTRSGCGEERGVRQFLKEQGFRPRDMERPSEARSNETRRLDLARKKSIGTRAEWPPP